MKIKWEPLALMVLVLGLAVWLVGGRTGLRQDPRVSPSSLAVYDIKIGKTRGVIELGRMPGPDPVTSQTPHGDRAAGQQCRILLRDKYASEWLTQAQLGERFGAELAREIFTTKSNTIVRLFNITSWASFAWVAVGLAGQLAFSGRTMIQWLISEHKGKSTVPAAYWWLSLAGGLMLFMYFVWRQDLVGVLGQSSGLVVYARNLRLLAKERALVAQVPRGGESSSPVAASV